MPDKTKKVYKKCSSKGCNKKAEAGGKCRIHAKSAQVAADKPVKKSTSKKSVKRKPAESVKITPVKPSPELKIEKIKRTRTAAGNKKEKGVLTQISFLTGIAARKARAFFRDDE